MSKGLGGSRESGSEPLSSHRLEQSCSAREIRQKVGAFPVAFNTAFSMASIFLRQRAVGDYSPACFTVCEKHSRPEPLPKKKISVDGAKTWHLRQSPRLLLTCHWRDAPLDELRDSVKASREWGCRKRLEH